MGEPHAPERRVVGFGVTPRTLAILPLKPLVAGDRDEALELDVTETLINQLSRVSGLTVRPLVVLDARR